MLIWREDVDIMPPRASPMHPCTQTFPFPFLEPIPYREKQQWEHCPSLPAFYCHILTFRELLFSEAQDCKEHKGRAKRALLGRRIWRLSPAASLYRTLRYPRIRDRVRV